MIRRKYRFHLFEQLYKLMKQRFRKTNLKKFITKTTYEKCSVIIRVKVLHKQNSEIPVYDCTFKACIRRAYDLRNFIMCHALDELGLLTKEEVKHILFYLECDKVSVNDPVTFYSFQ